MIKQLFRLWIWLFHFDYQKHFDLGKGLIIDSEIAKCKIYGLEGKILRASYYNNDKRWFVGYVFYPYPLFQKLMYSRFQLKNFEIISVTGFFFSESQEPSLHQSD